MVEIILTLGLIPAELLIWNSDMKPQKDLLSDENRRDLNKKKKKLPRPYIIEHTYRNVSKFHPWMKRWEDKWTVSGKYASEKSALLAMKSHEHNRVHSFIKRNIQIMYYTKKSCINEICRFGIFINGNLEQEYRLVKQVKEER